MASPMQIVQAVPNTVIQPLNGLTATRLIGPGQLPAKDLANILETVLYTLAMKAHMTEIFTSQPNFETVSKLLK